MLDETQEISTEVEAGAIVAQQPILGSPRQKLTKAMPATEAKEISPSSTSSRKGRRAIKVTAPIAASPSRDVPQAEFKSSPLLRSPAEPELSGQNFIGNLVGDAAQPHSVGQPGHDAQLMVADRTELPGHWDGAAHHVAARQPNTDCGHSNAANQAEAAAVGSPLADQGHHIPAAHNAGALVGEITAIYRRYEDLRRARQRIELQAIATCRNVCGGDKVEGMKLYKSPTPQVEVWLTPYRLAMQPLDAAIKEQEKLLTKLGKALPVREWADTVPGLSPRFLAAIIGECGIGPGQFKSVSALWKRMGMAVINGGRQRRVTGDAALEHGYVARRRALMWNIGDQVAVRQGIRNPKDEEGKPTGATAINEWGALYLERKAYELAREIDGKALSPMHAHNRAKRYVEKRLLRELWRAWRRASLRSATRR